MAMKRLVTCRLKTRREAEAAVKRVLDDGHVRSDISLLIRDKGGAASGVMVAGPIAAAGAAKGGLTGGLIDTGLPEQCADIYETGMQKGGILVGVQARSRSEVDRLEGIFEDFHAEHVRVRNTGEDPSTSFDWRPICL